jgi:hypothetical protein
MGQFRLLLDTVKSLVNSELGGKFPKKSDSRPASEAFDADSELLVTCTEGELG